MKNKSTLLLIGLVFALLGIFPTVQAAALAPGDVVVVDPSAPGEAGVFQFNPLTWQATLISTNGYFAEPMGIALSSDGSILIGDPQYPNGSGPGAIFKIDPVTGEQTIISAGNMFVDPRGIAVAANGDIFVADSDAFGYYGGVVKVDPNTGAQTKIYQSADINAGPIYLAFEAGGDLVVSDVSGTSKGVVRVNPATGAGVQLSAGGNFVWPQAIAVAANGDIFVADNGGKIIKVDPVSGNQTVIASGYPLACPVGIAFDNLGDLLVSDPCNEPGAIIKVNPVTGAASVVANNFGSVSPNGLTVVPQPPQSEVVFQPAGGLNDGTDDGSALKGQDTYISGTKYGDWDTNYGSNNELFFDYYIDYDGYPLLKFDVSTLPSDAASAELYLYITGDCGGGSCPDMNWTVNAITAPWNEMTATWNTRPALSGDYGTLNIPASPTGAANAKWVSVDITSLYNGWKNGTIPNYGIGFTRLGYTWDGGVWFNNAASSDYETPSLRPKLVINGGFNQADVQPPVITVPSDIITEAVALEGAAVVYEASATDNVGVTSFACAPASGSVFPIGTTAVTCTASDASGNSASASFNVTVNPPAGYTAPGDNVVVTLDAGVSLTFASIVDSGITTVAVSSAGPALPTQFKLGNPPVYYDITTTASYISPIEVCFSYAGVNYNNESNLKLRHFDGTSWIDITKPGYPDTLSDVICGVTNSLSPFVITEPAEQNVTIDIKPGGYPNSINPKSSGKIPVAILSTAQFNALMGVDKTSLTFGRTGDELSLAFCNIGGEDVNRDGLLDLLCHFQTKQAGFQPGDTEGKLKGKTISGIPLTGKDSVRIVPVN